jgi:hypothetical protein
MTKWDEIFKRAEIVWRDPDYFKNFEVEEVGIMTDLFVPNMVVVSYILWGTRYNGRREKCCKYSERRPADEPDNRNRV